MRFRSDAFAEFARQLMFAPPKRRRAHMDRAELLYWEIDAEHSYPLDFVVYRVTGYRPDTFKLTSVAGEQLRHDLLVLVERLSASLDETFEAYDPRPLTLEQVQDRLNVTSKTIQRYRRQGLFARRLIQGNTRRRLAFLPESVARFLADRAAVARSASSFSRIDEDTRHAILTRARRMVVRRAGLTPFQVARHLAPKFDRSVEAVRRLLLRHDRRDPRVAIFPRHTPPLTEKQQRIIHRAYHRGIHVRDLARRFGKSRNSVYRAIHQRRAAAIRALPLDYVASPTFELPDAEQIILEADLPEAAGSDAPRTAADESDGDLHIGRIYGDEPHSAELERALFVRYNYLKYRAAKVRDRLDVNEPRSRDLDQIETWLRRAVATKLRIVRGNLRLVVSVARKHLGSRSRGRGEAPALDELIAEGNRVLLDRIERYDPGRVNRFGPYLAWALMRRFASFTPAASVETGQANGKAARPAATPAFDRAAGMYWPVALNPVHAAVADSRHMARELAQLLEPLNEGERLVVTRHFGIDEDGAQLEPQTLAMVAKELDVTVERARQIEHRALAKVRRTAARVHLAHPLGSVSGPVEATGVSSAGKKAPR